MNLVVAVDKNWGIGYRGNLLVRIREDLNNFAALTTGKTVVLGSNTLATFPRGAVLKNRTNIVLNPSPDYHPEGAIVAHSIDELHKILEDFDTDSVWVIGGMSIYRQLLPCCNRAYVTVIDADFVKDAYFPDLDEMPEWKRVFTGEVRESAPEDQLGQLTDGTVPGKVTYRFTVYSKDSQDAAVSGLQA